MSDDKLKELRGEIDGIDDELLALVSRRAEIAKAIGEAKARAGLAVWDAARERAVLERLRGRNPGPLDAAAIEAVFREVISACRAVETPIRVACLGPRGTFSHAAVIKQFGHGVELEVVPAIADVFAAVEVARAKYGVVPIENTTEGAVTPTLDALATTTLRVLSEFVLKIEHHVMSKSGAVADVKRIVSLPQPLAQCRRTLAEKFPGVPIETAASTAAAAQAAADDESTAAVAGELAATLYGLRTVAAHVQDEPGNVTRFLVVGTDAQRPKTGRDRTSLVISVRDEVGVLGRVLQPFTQHGVNLSMIQSRPLPGSRWEYRFFVDVGGHVDDANVKRALTDVDRIAISTKVLGSYPVAD